MSNCEKCGRDEGHWMGCQAAPSWGLRDAIHSFVEKAIDNMGLACEHGECSNPKRPPGKGPKPKYCTEHSDPKSRKA